MKGLSFLANNELYAVDVSLVEKLARRMAVTPVPYAPAVVAGVGNTKGKIITVFNPFGLGCANTVNVIIFKPFSDGGGQIGLVIDKTGDLIDIDDEAVTLPRTEAGSYRAEVAEAAGMLYRIIDVNNLRNIYI
jgi:chemotaxis signal transduction protein